MWRASTTCSQSCAGNRRSRSWAAASTSGSRARPGRVGSFSRPGTPRPVRWRRCSNGSAAPTWRSPPTSRAAIGSSRGGCRDGDVHHTAGAHPRVRAARERAAPRLPSGRPWRFGRRVPRLRRPRRHVRARAAQPARLARLGPGRRLQPSVVRRRPRGTARASRRRAAGPDGVLARRDGRDRVRGGVRRTRPAARARGHARSLGGGGRGGDEPWDREASRQAVVRRGSEGDRGGTGGAILLGRTADRERAEPGPALLPPLGGQRAGRARALRGLRASRAAPLLQHGRVPALRPPRRAALDRGPDAGRRRRRRHDRWPGLRGRDRPRVARSPSGDHRRLGPLRLRRAARGVPRRADRLPPLTEDAVAALRAGRAVILPTDTVYGLCALPEHEDVLYELKGRDRSKPVALLAADAEALVTPVPPRAAVSGVGADALAKYLPGPCRVVVGKVGVRVPRLPAQAAEVVQAVGIVAATSANLSGGPDPRRVADVPEEIRAACGAIVDAGELPGMPSTVIELTGDEPRVLRQGAGPVPEPE